MDENKQKIRAFLAQYFRGGEWQDGEDFFAVNQVNSLFAMQLVLFLEREFGIQLAGDDLVLNNFRSINNLSALVERKQSSVATGAAPDAARDEPALADGV
jgi:acyl carrier protein